MLHLTKDGDITDKLILENSDEECVCFTHDGFMSYRKRIFFCFLWREGQNLEDKVSINICFLPLCCFDIQISPLWDKQRN